MKDGTVFTDHLDANTPQVQPFMPCPFLLEELHNFSTSLNAGEGVQSSDALQFVISSQLSQYDLQMLSQQCCASTVTKLGGIAFGQFLPSILRIAGFKWIWNTVGTRATCLGGSGPFADHLVCHF